MAAIEQADRMIVRTPWAITLPRDARNAIARLRLRADISAALDGDTLWLRGEAGDAELPRALEQLAPTATYCVQVDDTLIRIGETLPSGRLPNLRWAPIRQFVDATMPQSLLAGVVFDRVSITLVPSSLPRPANALLTRFARLADWADDAAAFRLDPLRYAVSGDRALVLGEPLPSIEGMRLHEAEGICVPCGWAVSPEIDPGSLRSILRLEAGSFALIEATSWHRIPPDAFVPMTRASVRLTLRKRAGK